MRSFTFVASLLLAKSVHAVNYKLDCDSGVPDSNSQLASLTPAICAAACKNSCESKQDIDSIESCLSQTELVGCLFDILAIEDEDATLECVNTAEVDGSNPGVLITIPSTSLKQDGVSEVSTATMELKLGNANEVATSCTLTTVNVGVARVFDKQACTFEGSPASTPSFVIDGQYMSIDIKDAVILNNAEDLTLFVTFVDQGCASIDVKDVDVQFGFVFRDGYRPTVECKQLSHDCMACQANGCTFCDWSSTVDVLLPGFLPDWDWIDDAKNGNNAVCGLNTALCVSSLGRVNTCGSETIFATTGALLVTAALYF